MTTISQLQKTFSIAEPMRWSSRIGVAFVFLLFAASAAHVEAQAPAEEPQPNAEAPATTKPQQSSETTKPSVPLAEEQDSLAKQFSDLENLLLKLSAIESDSNPIRASLLQRASKLGKESSVESRLKEAAKLLQNKQFSRAIEEQQATKESLKQLLDLLLSEDRDDRVKEDKKKIEEMIKEIQRLNRQQRSLRGRTESADQPKELAQDQADLEQKADELSQELQGESPESPPAESEDKPAENNSQEPNKESSNNDQKSESNAENTEASPTESKTTLTKSLRRTRRTSQLRSHLNKMTKTNLLKTKPRMVTPRKSPLSLQSHPNPPSLLSLQSPQSLLSLRSHQIPLRINSNRISSLHRQVSNRRKRTHSNQTPLSRLRSNKPLRLHNRE
jgi:hypothetical protein